MESRYSKGMKRKVTLTRVHMEEIGEGKRKKSQIMQHLIIYAVLEFLS